jgi:hypothetical protein
LISIAGTAIRETTEQKIAVNPRVKTTIVAAKNETKLLLCTLVITNLVATAAVPAAMTIVVAKILLLALIIRKRNFL